jgi:hypothetical protein
MDHRRDAETLRKTFGKILTGAGSLVEAKPSPGAEQAEDAKNRISRSLGVGKVDHRRGAETLRKTFGEILTAALVEERLRVLVLGVSASRR